jgi:ERCC4-type nuclease
MITLDNRVGSKELLRLFPPGNAQLGHLEYGDASFIGNGDGVPYTVGVERKKIPDLLNCITSGRLSGHQLIGMLNTYNVSYLVVEGVHRPNPDTGLLEVWKRGRWNPVDLGSRRFMARDMWAFLQTMEIVTGIHTWHTCTERETAQWIGALHYWWTNKEYGDHRGHLQAHTMNQVELSKHSTVRRVSATLKGVGWERAKEIDTVFGSVEQMVGATVEEWKAIDGIGDKLSRSIWSELRGV